MRYNKKSVVKKPEKIQCEICGIKDKKILHLHHIVERTELNTSNHPMNLAVLCANCHGKIHAKIIKIVGVYPSTGVGGRTLVYEESGIKNVEGIDSAYFIHKPESVKIR